MPSRPWSARASRLPDRVCSLRHQARGGKIDLNTGEVTRHLTRWRSGDNSALVDLMPLIYVELRKLAAIQLSRESG